MDSKTTEVLGFIFCMAFALGIIACIGNGTLAWIEGERIGSTFISNVPWSEEAYVRITYMLISGVIGLAGLIGLGALFTQRPTNE